MKINFSGFALCAFKGKLKNIFAEALKTFSLAPIGFSVNLKFVSAEEIQALNKQFRDIDKPTDVLSFPSLNLHKAEGISTDNLKDAINPDDGCISLGDIAICKSVARQQAKDYGHSLRREICFLALHGFLHLLGFDHLTPEDEQEMQDHAKKILEKQKVKRNV